MSNNKEDYNKQLANLNVNRFNNYVNMQLHSSEGKTKFMMLNKDSLFSLIDFAVRVGIVSLEDVEYYLS